MTAVITASRWNAIHPDYKTGSPTEGTAGILRLTTDMGTVLVPAEIVDRRRLFAFGPLVATPGALRALVAKEQTPLACSPATAKATGALCPPMTTTPTTRPSAAGSASSAPTTWDPPDCGSSPTPRPTAPRPLWRAPPLRHDPPAALRVLTRARAPRGCWATAEPAVTDAG